MNEKMDICIHICICIHIHICVCIHIKMYTYFFFFHIGRDAEASRARLGTRPRVVPEECPRWVWLLPWKSPQRVYAAGFHFLCLLSFFFWSEHISCRSFFLENYWLEKYWLFLCLLEKTKLFVVVVFVKTMSPHYLFVMNKHV